MTEKQKPTPSLQIKDTSKGDVRRVELKYTRSNKKTGDKTPVSIDKLIESLSTELMIDKPKPRRTKEDFPDPNKQRDHDVNRLDKHFQSRIDEETDQNIRAFLKATGMTKKEATQRAFNLLIELYDYE